MFYMIAIMFSQYRHSDMVLKSYVVFLLALHQVVGESLYPLLLSDASQRLCLRTGTSF